MLDRVLDDFVAELVQVHERLNGLVELKLVDRRRSAALDSAVVFGCLFEALLLFLVFLDTFSDLGKTTSSAGARRLFVLLDNWRCSVRILINFGFDSGLLSYATTACVDMKISPMVLDR